MRRHIAKGKILFQGGIYYLQIMDNYVGGWTLLIIGFAENVAIAYCYGKLWCFFKRIQQMSIHVIYSQQPFVILILFSITVSFFKIKKDAFCVHCSVNSIYIVPILKSPLFNVFLLSYHMF